MLVDIVSAYYFSEAVKELREKFPVWDYTTAKKKDVTKFGGFPKAKIHKIVLNMYMCTVLTVHQAMNSRWQVPVLLNWMCRKEKYVSNNNLKYLNWYNQEKM